MAIRVRPLAERFLVAAVLHARLRCPGDGAPIQALAERRASAIIACLGAGVMALAGCGEAPSAPLWGSIGGRVTLADDPFPGVIVTATRDGESWSRTTNASGEYRFDLTVGDYRLTVSGYKESVHFQESSKNVRLAAVGQISATVDFEAEYIGTTSEDREALQALYHSTAGALWHRSEHWMSDRPLEQWDGVTTNAAGRVSHLILVGNNLDGPIPPAIGALQELNHLDLTGNNLTGRLPAELGGLRLLERLSLRRNYLSGPLPASLTHLARLVHLDLADNNLGEALPERMGAMVSLQVLQLSDNRFTGQIPLQLGNVTALRHIDLSSNELEGLVPASLGNLYRLKTLQLSNNRLMGHIPAEFGKLHALESLDLTRNRIGGSIPSSLGSISTLRSVLLGMNELSGGIPAELGKLQVLRQLDVSENRLVGPLPPALGSLHYLEFLRLRGNRIDGPLPDSIGYAQSLSYLDLGSNALSGSLPPSLGKLDALEVLELSDNEIGGELPAELGGMEALERLALGGNRISGAIPVGLADALSLRELDLVGNPLSGALPAEIARLGSLVALHLADTGLEGLLPRSLTELGLEEFNFVDSDLCSPPDRVFRDWLDQITYLAENLCAPAFRDRVALVDLFHATGGDGWTRSERWLTEGSLGDWDGVEVDENGRVSELDLRNNELTGPMPLSIPALSGLRRLDLGGNGLTGRLPPDLAALGELEVARLDGNPLEGPLPNELTQLALSVFDFSGTGLCAPPGDSFQEWLGGIDERAGETCTLPPTVQLSAPVVYLTQGVQRADGSVPLIAGRDAFLRVFVTGDPVSFYRPEVEAVVLRHGLPVRRITMARDGPPLEPSVDEGRLAASYNSVVPGDLLEPGAGLRILIDPKGELPLAPGSVTTIPAEGHIDLDVLPLPPMLLTVVPVMRDGWDDSSVLGWAKGMHAASPQFGLLRKAFPLGRFEVMIREPYVTSSDLQSFGGWGEFLREISLLRSAEGGRGYYYGAVSQAYGAYVKGFAFQGLPVAVGITDPTIMTHELGHSMGLGHAPCGGANSPDPDFPHAGGRIGIWGTDYQRMRLIAPSFGRDVMGYCFGEDRDWLSDYHFEKALHFRLSDEAEAAGDQMRPTGPMGARVPSLVVWGVAEGPQGPSLDPSVIVDLPAAALTDAPGGLPGGLWAEAVAGTGLGGRRGGSTAPVFADGQSGAAGSRGGGSGYVVIGTDARGEVLFRRRIETMEDSRGWKHFVSAFPVEPSWAGALSSIALEGPSGQATLGGSGTKRLAVAVDSEGRLRAVLRDWRGELPARLGSEVSLSVSGGVPTAGEQVSAVARR